jgi:hypothetical protein
MNRNVQCFLSGATGFLLLDGGTFDRPIGTKYATIPWLGFQQGPTRFAIIEKMAGIGRHYLFFGVTAVRTRNRGFENHRTHFVSALTEDG